MIYHHHALDSITQTSAVDLFENYQSNDKLPISPLFNL